MAKKNKAYLNNPNLPAVGTQFEYTPEQVQELLKCKSDILHFAEKYFDIVNLDSGKGKIQLYPYQKDALQMIHDNRFNILLFSRQTGKALALDTLVPVPGGWKTMGELVKGDKVYALDGSTCNVVHAHDVLHDRECFEIVFDNGEKIVADGDHQWFTQTANERDKKNKGSVKTTKQIAETLKKKNSQEPNHRIPMNLNGVEGDVQDLPIHPYILGLWLGDGTSATGSIVSGARDVENTIENIRATKQFDKIIVKQYGSSSATMLRMTCEQGSHTKSLSTLLRKNNLINNKHIPHQYMIASRQQRIELLQGLMDSDGYVDKNGAADFTNSNIKLVHQVRELVQSLGYKATLGGGVAKLDGSFHKPFAKVSFKPRELVCKLPFKAQRIVCEQRENSSLRNRWHYIKDITPVASVSVRCITVDSIDNLFLVGKQYIPTHNSTISTIYLLWHAIFNDDQHILLVANKEDTAKEIFSKVRLAFEGLPLWLKPGVKEYGKEGMELANGSKIKITTTTSSAGRGSSCNVLFMDEADHVDHNILKSFWAAVFPIISSSTKSKIIMASTPRDTSGLFYKLYQKSLNTDDPDNVWHSRTVKWYDVPGRDEKWARDTRAGMDDPAMFEIEFECVFQESGESAVSQDLFNKLRRRTAEPEHIYMEGKYKLWESPNPERLYVAGVDVAEGLGKDYTVATILDITDLKSINQVAMFACNTTSPSEFTPKLNEILCHWGRPPLMIERNNCGAQVVDNLRKDFQYDNIINHGARELGRSKIPLGVISHGNTKYDCVQNQRYWINTMDVVQINDVQTVEELRDFIRYPSGKWAAKSGKHDDRVMAISWALNILSDKLVHKYYEIINVDENNKPAMLRPMDYGVKYFTNPQSMYVDERNGMSVDALPVLFGGQFGDDIADLQAQGWEFMQQNWD